jgi:acetyltransferase-like isoleucine patch superfamily enzyme
VDLKDIVKNSVWLRKLSYKFLFWLRGNELKSAGSRNVIEIEGAQVERCLFKIHGSGNKIKIQPGASVKDCQIEIYGDNHKLLIETNVVLTQSIIWFEDHNCLISIGEGTTMQRNGHIAVTEPFRKIEIGKRCMFSFNVDIRNGDSHTLFDIESKKRSNWAKDIVIENRVWLGAHSQILGGAFIKEGSTIGIRSLVNGEIPENCIAVGSPAKPVKSGFNWDSKRWLEGDPRIKN